MDMKQLLEKMTQFAGQAVGQKPGEQWKGTDKAPPGKKLVGDSILKDLSKGPTPKSREQELSEEFEAFLQALEEENLGVHPKRPGRKSDRPSRGHKELPRYKTIKADEHTIKGPHGYLDVEKKNGVTTVKRQAWDSSGPWGTDVPGGKSYPNPRRDGTGVGVAAGDGIPSSLGSRRKQPRIEPDYTERERDLDEAGSPARGHKEQPRYKTIKADEGATPFMTGIENTTEYKQGYATAKLPVPYPEGTQQYTNYYKGVMDKTGPQIKEAGSPAQQAAIAIAMKKAGKKPKNESIADQVYTVDIERRRFGRDSTTRSTSGTLAELLDYFGYTLEVGKSYEHERGRYKINMTPKTIQQLVDNLNKAASNGAANGAASTYYSVGQSQVAESVINEGTGIGDLIKFKQPYKHKGQEYLYGHVTGFSLNPDKLGVGMGYGHTAATPFMGAEARGLVVKLKPTPYHTDDYADKVTVPLDSFVKLGSALGGGAVQSEIHKFNKLYGFPKPGDRIDYSKILGQEVDEGWGGSPGAPDDRQRPEPDPDEWYDRKRQEKIDAEAEAEQAKRPQTKIYSLLGRGPNMEPNYKFPGEYDSLEAAIAARKELMAKSDTPHPEHIGIHSRTKYLDQTNEAVQGGGGIKNLEDYTTKRDYIYQQLADPKQKDNYDYFRQALFDLNRLAKEKGINIAESRAHKQLATWFKNRELAQKYASGEVKIPTTQERKAELEKSKKQVKEYGADQPQGTAGQTSLTQANSTDPKQAAAVTQATQALKSATQSSAPAPLIAKAIDAASQGKPVGQQDMKNIEPLMKDIATVAQDPKLATQFKTLAQQIQQTQQKQQQKKA